MTTQAAIVATLTALSTQVAKIGEESKVTLQNVTDLEAAIANANTSTPEVDAALAALKAQVQMVDDLVPDAPAVTTTG